jgi:hypothetical protein
MEIFIPGLTALLLLALVLFLVLPRLGTPVLAILSLVLLVYAVNNHIQMFYSEYRYSTWQESVKPYASFLIVGLVLFLILGYVLYLFGIGSGNSLPVSNASPIMGVINATKANTSSTGVVGNVVNTVANAATGVVNATSGVATGVSNVAKNITTNLGNMLSTPKSVSNNRGWNNRSSGNNNRYI